jgi:hypothetical protein
VEEMGEDIKQWRMKVCRILFIIFQLAFKVISRIIEGMDLINPKGFLIEGVDP